jgi:hypothetical protein
LVISSAPELKACRALKQASDEIIDEIITDHWQIGSSAERSMTKDAPLGVAKRIVEMNSVDDSERTEFAK